MEAQKLLCKARNHKQHFALLRNPQTRFCSKTPTQKSWVLGHVDKLLSLGPQFHGGCQLTHETARDVRRLLCKENCRLLKISNQRWHLVPSRLATRSKLWMLGRKQWMANYLVNTVRSQLNTSRRSHLQNNLFQSYAELSWVLRLYWSRPDLLALRICGEATSQMFVATVTSSIHLAHLRKGSHHSCPLVSHWAIHARQKICCKQRVILQKFQHKGYHPEIWATRILHSC